MLNTAQRPWQRWWARQAVRAPMPPPAPSVVTANSRGRGMRVGFDFSPRGGALISPREGKHARLSARAAANLQPNRQPRAGKPTGHRDTRQPQHVDGPGVAQYL